MLWMAYDIWRRTGIECRMNEDGACQKLPRSSFRQETINNSLFSKKYEISPNWERRRKRNTRWINDDEEILKENVKSILILPQSSFAALPYWQEAKISIYTHVQLIIRSMCTWIIDDKTEKTPKGGRELEMITMNCEDSEGDTRGIKSNTSLYQSTLLLIVNIRVIPLFTFYSSILLSMGRKRFSAPLNQGNIFQYFDTQRPFRNFR